MPTFVQLLGSPAIQHDGAWQSLPKGLVAALIYYLACEGTWQTREELAYLMWADVPEDKARKNLRNLLGRVRKFDFMTELEVEPSRIRWQVATDVASFQDLVTEDNYAQALQTYQGDFLASFYLDDAVEFSEWLESKRQKLQRLHQQAVLGHVEELEAQGLHGEAAQSLEPLRQADPFDEIILRRQLQNYQASGQASLALDAFEAFKTQLIHEFGADPEQATVDLVARIQQVPAEEVTASEEASTAVDTSARKANPHHNLPSQLTPFVGRELERQRIAEQLADLNCRLLTLVAPGGIGKTRLSLAVAYEKLAHFKDGVYFIPFEAVNDPEKMPYELANALNLNLSGQENPKAQLFSYLADKELLLVLDNLEHLISGVGLISELLAKTTALKILATSREQLN
ncbi:MAG: BTAD domain-containing putative transcriptional regulator, partial [Deinococcota bacterium]